MRVEDGLRLVAATEAHVEAELRAPAELGVMLGAEVPASWPPGEYDADAQRFILGAMREAGAAGAGWFGWYAVRVEDARVVGTIGFFGPPRGGEVEIGYSVCEEERRRGHARAMVAAMLGKAFADPRVERVVARTTRGNLGSVRVLESNGFVEDSGSDEELRFVRGRGA